MPSPPKKIKYRRINPHGQSLQINTVLTVHIVGASAKCGSPGALEVAVLVDGVLVVVRLLLAVLVPLASGRKNHDATEAHCKQTNSRHQTQRAVVLKKQL